MRVVVQISYLLCLKLCEAWSKGIWGTNILNIVVEGEEAEGIILEIATELINATD